MHKIETKLIVLLRGQGSDGREGEGGGGKISEELAV